MKIQSKICSFTDTCLSRTVDTSRILLDVNFIISFTHLDESSIKVFKLYYQATKKETYIFVQIFNYLKCPTQTKRIGFLSTISMKVYGNMLPKKILTIHRLKRSLRVQELSV